MPRMMEVALSRISEKPVQSVEPHMPAILEARTMLCAVPLDMARGESKGVWLQRAARLLGLRPAKAKRIYYGEVKSIDADTFQRMRSSLDELKRSAARRQERLNDVESALGAITRLAGESARQHVVARDAGCGEGGTASRPAAAAAVSRPGR